MLAMQALREGLRLLERLLADAGRDAASIPRRMQDPARVRRLGWAPPERGTIHWRWPAAKIARFVRACDYLPLRSPWPAPQAWLGDEAIGIARARDTGVAADAPPGSIRRGADGQPWVATGDRWLEVTRLCRRDGTEIAFTDAAGRLEPGMLLREAR
jgi:methionyl-tRNA formyltransferase